MSPHALTRCEPHSMQQLNIATYAACCEPHEKSNIAFRSLRQNPQACLKHMPVRVDNQRRKTIIT